MIGGDEIHICDSLMHRLKKDKSIGQFKRSALGSYTHVSNSITKQNRLKMMIAQDICDDASEHDTEIDNDDLEHLVRKVFNHVQDVSRVDAVINALKHVNLEQCMKQLEFQYGTDKLKLFLLKSTNLPRPVCCKIAIGMAQYKRVGNLEFFRTR